jgi:hypothetical protein
MGPKSGGSGKTKKHMSFITKELARQFAQGQMGRRPTAISTRPASATTGTTLLRREA